MNIRRIVFFLVCTFGVFLPGVVFAANPGGIDATYKYARLCSNDDCSSYTIVNFKPTNTSVIVSNGGISGYIWSSKLGWINLSPTNGGVQNTPSGVVSGYGWGQGAGWVNFRPTNGGVNISTTTGEFSGYAWVNGGGWMRFDCSLADACVKTDWNPNDSGGSGDTGGSGGAGGVGTAGTAGTAGTTGGDTTTGTTSTGGDTTTGTTAGTGDTTTGDATTGGDTTGGTTSGDGSIGTGSSGGDSGSGGGGWWTSGGSSSGGIFGPSTPIGVVAEEIKKSFVETVRAITVARQEVRDVVTTPEGNAITQAVSSIGIVGGTAISVGSALFLNPLTFSEIFLIPIRLWSLFLGAVGLAKRRRPWGTVYDSVTKQPLDPAYVVLRDDNGTEMATTITDLDGRFGFVIPRPGRYSIVAHKTNYIFPSQKLVGRDHDEVYRDLYFGELIEATTPGEVVFRNIPMDPEKFDWNEFAKRKKKLIRYYSNRDRWLLHLSDVLFAVGFIVASIAVLAAPKTYNIVVFGLYAILFFVRRRGLHSRPFGYIQEAETGFPVSFGIIRISSVGTGVEIMHRVTDASGRYYCLLPNGEYNVRIDHKLADGGYQTVMANTKVLVTKGFLAKNFAVESAISTYIPPRQDPPSTPQVQTPSPTPVVPPVPTIVPMPESVPPVQSPVSTPSVVDAPEPVTVQLHESQIEKPAVNAAPVAVVAPTQTQTVTPVESPKQEDVSHTVASNAQNAPKYPGFGQGTPPFSQ